MNPGYSSHHVLYYDKLAFLIAKADGLKCQNVFNFGHLGSFKRKLHISLLYRKDFKTFFMMSASAYESNILLFWNVAIASLFPHWVLHSRLVKLQMWPLDK